MLLLAALTVGSGSAWAETKTSNMVFDKACNGSGTADDGVTWTVTSDGTESTFDSTKGIHYGTGSSSVGYIQLNTSGITGTITKVVVNASTASGVSATLSVTVGGATFGETASLTSTATSYTLTGSASGEIVVRVAKPSKATKALYLRSIRVTYEETSELEDCDLALTDAPVALTFDLYNNSAAQTISYTTSSTGAVSVAASDYATFSVDQTNKTITVTPKTAVTPSAQTITVSQEADETYAAGSVTFTLSVANSDPNVPGTENNPYTVAQAIANTPSSGTSANVYIKGIVSKFQASDIISDGANYRYYISDDGTTTNQLLVYKGKGLNNVTFSSADDLLVGDEVVILGGLTTFNSTKEVAANNYIVSLTRPASIQVASTTINVDAEGYTDEVTVTPYGIDSTTGLDIVFYEADGTTTTTYSWITANINNSGNLKYIVEENEGAARSAYLKVYGLDSEANDVYSELITITQSAAKPSLTLGKAYVVCDWSGFSGSYITTTTEETINDVVFDVNQVCKQVDLQLKASVGEMTSQVIKSANGYSVIIVTGEGSNASGILTVQIGDETAQTVTGASKTLTVTTSSTSAKFTIKNQHSGAMRIKSITIIPIINSPAVQSYGWASYIAAQDVEFAAGTAYVVTDASLADGLTLEEVTQIPAGTPVLLKGEGTKSVTLLNSTPDAPTTNLLSIGTGSVASDSYAYVLAKDGDGAAFKQWDGEATVLNGRVVLLLDEAVASSRSIFVLGNEATGISDIENTHFSDGSCFDLQGRRVAQPTKGLYIVNGRKFIQK